MDFTQQIGGVRRQVGDRDLETGEGRVVTISQAYQVDLEELWDACTNGERLARWFAPVTGELRLGGRYQVEDNAGGTVRSCDPPNGFSATWESAGDVSWIEVRLTAEPDGFSRLQLEHLMPANAHWDRFGPGATGVGWDLSLVGLAAHLSGEEVGAEAEVWASESGLRFLADSSDAWREAYVRAGADAATARAMADQTTAFYAWR